MKTKKVLMLFTTFFIYYSVAFAFCDSIRVVGFNDYTTSIVALSRNRFLQMLNDNTMEFDTTIINKNDISYIEECIKTLTIKEKLIYDANDIVEKKPIDNQILLILHYQQKKEYIWISMFYVDRKKYRYYINDRFKEFLSRYTDLFADF